MRPKRTPTIATKLTPVDHIRYEQFCRMEGKSKTEVARKAIIEYMERKEKGIADERETMLEARVRRMEDRLAGLMVKLGIGIYGLEHLFWTRSNPDGRKELFTECYISGVKRMNQKLKKEEEELRHKTTRE